jgi:hypothetical protein
MKDKYAMMYDGKQWTLTTKEDLITKIYEDKKSYIEENLVGKRLVRLQLSEKSL